MKMATKRSQEQVREFEPTDLSEQCFRHPAIEEISEISCHTDAWQLIENDQPDDFDGPDVWIS